VFSKSRRYTFDEFCRLTGENKADLIDGKIIVSPSETPYENDRFMWLLCLLNAIIRGGEYGRLFGSKVVYRLDQYNAPEPDLAFVASNRRPIVLREYVNGPPDLVLEIVSRESASRDRVTKRELYEQAGVREYWLVDVQRHRTTLLRLTPERKYRTVRSKRGILESQVIPGFWLRTAWLWQSELPDHDDVLGEILAGPPQ